jgi:hypothetical protein
MIDYNFGWHVSSRFDIFTWRNQIGYPAQLGLIGQSIHPSVRPSDRPSVRPFVCLSVCLSVHACRLGIQQKMAQAQQIRLTIL